MPTEIDKIDTDSIAFDWKSDLVACLNLLGQSHLSRNKNLGPLVVRYPYTVDEIVKARWGKQTRPVTDGSKPHHLTEFTKA